MNPSNPTSPLNPANPANPNNPLHPANPTSPTNPANMPQHTPDDNIPNESIFNFPDIHLGSPVLDFIVTFGLTVILALSILFVISFIISSIRNY